MTLQDMSKLLVLTDIHITPPGELIIGLDPGARLQAVLDRMVRDHSDADHLLIMGDLVHFGTAEEYARLRGLMRSLPWPVTYMLGNHDDRDTFCATFPKAPVDAAGFVQSRINLPGAHVICLDTLAPDATPRHSGMLCDARLAWLRAELDRSPGTPKIVAMHHPPIKTGFDGMDRIGLNNRGAVQDLLSQATDLSLVLSGHIHRTIMGSMRGIPVAMLKSPCHQMPFQLGPGGSALSIDEPGAYGLVLIDPDGTICVHTEDVGVNAGAISDDPASL